MLYPSAPASCRPVISALFALLLPLLALASGSRLEAEGPPLRVKPVPPPKQVGELLRAQLAQTTTLIRAGEARATYGIDGTGQTVAVLDTGIRASHEDFTGKVVAQVNYTGDNAGNSTNAADGDGHGTHVSGIIAANDTHTGVAPGARIAALKVLDNTGSGDFAWIQNALDWVIANRQTHNITVVNMSLGDGGNYQTFGSNALAGRLRTLRNAGVAVCVAAGNDFYGHNSQQGMGYPAIFAESVSVGAVYDANVGGFAYGDGARANTTGPDRICPFSQRLHESAQATNRTDIFAPGAPITSTGISSDTSSATAHGTSQATPVIAGTILLMQQYYLRQKGSLPTVDQLEKWLRAGAMANPDGDNEDDNVANTGLTFPRVDVVGAMQALEADLNTGFSISGTVTLGGIALPGVSVSAGGTAATTAVDGRYTLSNLSAGTYTVTVSRTNYLLSPTSRSVTVGPNAAGIDFTAVQTAFSISGTITSGGTALSGVTVNAGNHSTTTNTLGQYAFAGLGSGTYTVTPARSGYTFQPVNRTVTVSPDQSNIDFAGTPVTYSIRGTVTLNGSGAGGVTVTAGGISTLTDGSGAYTLAGLGAGTYTVSPSRSGYLFSPASRSVSVAANVTGIDFAASRSGYTLQGTITAGSSGLAGVTVTAGGRTATTDANGGYTLSNVAAGAQTVIPSRANYSFAPLIRAITVTQDTSGLDFTATALAYEISGRVLSSGQGLAGVTLTAGSQSTTSGSDGSYTLGGLANGTYTVIAAAAGYSFSPSSRSTTVGPSRTGIDFAAQALYDIRGAVREGTAGLAGVSVTTTGRSATTDAQGQFVLSGLTAGTYTVRVAREGYAFTPATHSVVLTTNGADGIDFAGSAVPYLVSLTPLKSSIAGRKSTAVTVLFSRKVSQATTVTITSSSGIAIVPKVVRVPRNRDRMNFVMRTRKVTSVERVTLTASSGGISRSTVIAVQPRL